MIGEYSEYCRSSSAPSPSTAVPLYSIHFAAVLPPGPTRHCAVQVDRGWEGIGVGDGNLGRQERSSIVATVHVIILAARVVVRSCCPLSVAQELSVHVVRCPLPRSCPLSVAQELSSVRCQGVVRSCCPLSVAQELSVLEAEILASESESNVP
jgi:hypothetical protein